MLGFLENYITRPRHRLNDDLLEFDVSQLACWRSICILPFVIFLFKSRSRNLIKPFTDREIWLPLITGSIFATYFGISFWVVGMSLTTASTASILNQTATIFILIFAKIFLGEPFTRRRVLAILIALVGACLVFVG